MRKTPANDDARSSGRLEISDRDLADYVDDRLSAERRVAVEGFLACNPDLAAGVMRARHRRARGGGPRRAAWSHVAAAGFAACLLSGTVGWHAAAQPPVTADWREADGDAAPRYVEDALESRRAAQVRAAMLSQADSPNLDAVEVERALKVRAPQLPLGWRLVDVQVYPSDDGPALNLVVLTADRRRLNLFAVKADAEVSAMPVLAQNGRETVAYWERGVSAYVLLPDADDGDLLSDARALAGRG
jgi:anti-sigma factor RsiW